MRIRPLAVALATVVAVSSPGGSHATEAAAPERSGQPPAIERTVSRGFEENLGQLDPRIGFAARSDAGALFVTAAGAMFTWTRYSPKPVSPLVDSFTAYSPGLAPGFTPPKGGSQEFVGWRFLGMDVASRLTGEAPLSSDVHRICGSATQPAGTSARTFERVRQTGVYPGVDAVHYEGARGFEYDLIVHPGADPGQIAIAIDGASAVSIDATGALVLTTPSGDIRHQAPIAYQMRSGVREPVSCRYELGAARSVRFVLASYDHTRELVIDPVILSSLIFGGSDAEFSYNIAADNNGNSYLVGTTYSLDFPTILPFQPAYGGNADVYVVKIGPDGETPLWTTYLGGTGFDFGAGIAVDDLGRVYVSGTTSSATFPVTGGSFQPQIRGGSDAFLVRLSPDGQTVEYGTFLGGTNAETCNGLALDSSLNVAIIGTTSSTNLPLKDAFQTTNRGGQDAWVAVVNAGGGSLAFSTYAGGSQQDIPNAVDTDPDGNVYVAGFTQSTNFPTFNGFQGTFQGGAFDSFALKLTPSGALAYGSFLGSSGNDVAYAVAADDNGRVFVGGFTESSAFPLQAPFQDTFKGASDGFLALLPTTGASTPEFSTYFGGDGFDGFYSLTFVSGRLHGVGRTNSGASFPSVNPVPGTMQGPIDTFYVVIDPVGDREFEGQPRALIGFELLESSTLGDATTQNVTGVGSPEEGLNWGVTYFHGAQDFPTTGISDAFARQVGGEDPASHDLKATIHVPPVTDSSKFVVTYVLKNKGLDLIQGFQGQATSSFEATGEISDGTSTGVSVQFDPSDMKVTFESSGPLSPGELNLIVIEAVRQAEQEFVFSIVDLIAVPRFGMDQAPKDNHDQRAVPVKLEDFDPGDPFGTYLGQIPWDTHFENPPEPKGIAVNVFDGEIMKAPLGKAPRDRSAPSFGVGSREAIFSGSSRAFERQRYPGPTRGLNIYASATPNFTPSPANFLQFVPFYQTSSSLAGAPAGSYFRVTQVYGQAESSPSAVIGGPLPDVTKVKLAASKVIIDGVNFVGPVSVLFDGVPFESAAKLKKNDTRVQQKGLLATGETVGQYLQRRGRVLVTVKTAAGTSVHFYVE